MNENQKEESILAKLKDILQESCPEVEDWSSFGPSTTIESLGLDSLTILDLLYDIEQETGVHVEANEVVTFQSIGDINKLLLVKGG
tara:strand:- start:2389 stop:2646 length:258 start_codon:yes stop_codon:yes gene_type:complete